MRVLIIALALVPTSLSAADPLADLPESLRDQFRTMADAVHQIGMNRVERALEILRLDINPAFRSSEDRDKAREMFRKPFNQVGQFKFQFESYDLVAMTRISSQAYTIHGVANGSRGPVHFDFDVFMYEGQWHVHGFTFSVGWKREKTIPERAVYFEKPVVYRLDQQDVALQDRVRESAAS